MYCFVCRFGSFLLIRCEFHPLSSVNRAYMETSGLCNAFSFGLTVTEVTTLIKLYKQEFTFSKFNESVIVIIIKKRLK